MIGLLGQLVDGYDRKESGVWKQAATEYNQRTEEFNRWIDGQVMIIVICMFLTCFVSPDGSG